MHVFLLMLLIEAASCDCHARTNQLPHRSTIVHLFEWKWKDIADECERFLGPKGFGAVQVSPPSENLIMRLKHLKDTRPWYERYKVMSYKMITRSGNEEEFLNMTSRCNKVGVRVYADVVLNHMAGDHPTNIGTAGSTADFKNYCYPAVPYNREHFHDPCSINNYNIAKQVRECQLDGTKDLNHRNNHVRERIVDYLKKLLDLGVAGFRIDAAKHMWPQDLRAIYSQLHYFQDENLSKSKPYIYHEVTFNSSGEAVKPFEYIEIGDVTEFRVGDELKNMFRGFSALKLLYNWGSGWGLLPSKKAVVFIDSHETQRDSDVLNYKEAKAYRAAVAFVLAHPYGEPRVMSSYYFDKWEQGPPSDKDGNIKSPNCDWPNRLQKIMPCINGWVCEHRWRQIYQMVAFRNAVRGTNVTHWWDNGNNLIAFTRGEKGFIAFNLEDGKDMNVTLRIAMPPGEYCDVISGERDKNQCTGRKVVVTELCAGWRVAHIMIPAHAEDKHIAIHVGPESSLQVDLTTAPQGPIRQTKPHWHRELDPLPPLTSEPARIVSSKKEDRNITLLHGQPCKKCRQTTPRRHRERDPLPPFTTEPVRVKQTISRWHRERDLLPPLTSEPARIVSFEKDNKNINQIHGQSCNKCRQTVPHWHRERDPLPPVQFKPARVPWEKEYKMWKQTVPRWHRERDPLPSSVTFEPARVPCKEQTKIWRQTIPRWHRERDLLPPIPSDPIRIVSSKKEDKYIPLFVGSRVQLTQD